MIVEERIYDLNNGCTADYVRLAEKEGIAIQRPILGNLAGYYTTEIGPLNQIVHLWAYEDLEDRARRRAKLMADPEWQKYIPNLRPLVRQMQNKILLPLAFSPRSFT